MQDECVFERKRQGGRLTQWKPAGRLTGKPRACAMTELTLFYGAGYVSINDAREGEARTYVEVEEQRDEAAERQRDEDPLDREVPEGNDPVTVESRVEGRGDGEELDVRVLDVAGTVKQENSAEERLDRERKQRACARNRCRR